MKKMFLGLITLVLVTSSIGFGEDVDVIPTAPEKPAAGEAPAPETAKPTEQEAKADRTPARKRHHKRKHRRHPKRH